LAEDVRNRRISQTMQVADVDRQAEASIVDALRQFCKARHRVDEHAWLWFECQTNMVSHRVIAKLAAAVGQALQQDGVGCMFPWCPGPEAHSIRSQLAGDVDGPHQEIKP